MTQELDTLKDRLGEIVYGLMRGGMFEAAAKAKAIIDIRASFGPLLDGTLRQGSASHRLSREEVREMRRLHADGVNQCVIASRFNVSQATVFYHVSRHSRKSPSRSHRSNPTVESTSRSLSHGASGRGAGEAMKGAA